MIVVDASVMIDLLMRAPDADRLMDRLFTNGESLHAPHLIDVEVAQVLRRFQSRGTIGEYRGRQALEFLQQFPLVRHSHSPLTLRIWTLRENLTAYDGAYVALAEVLDATLLTRDVELAGAPGHSAVVEAI